MIWMAWKAGIGGLSPRRVQAPGMRVHWVFGFIQQGALQELYGRGGANVHVCVQPMCSQMCGHSANVHVQLGLCWGEKEVS